MLERIRNSVYTKALWGFMGLYLLNISVDTADPSPEHIPEDLSYNDQESIVEIFIEKVLGFEDAIEEYDDNDTEDHNKHKNVKIDLVVNNIEAGNIAHDQFEEKRKLFPNYFLRLTNGPIQIDSPPPKF